MDYIVFVAAIAVLIYGADIAIRQSERIAFYYNIPEFVIGATLVALGTSLPEMAASVSASVQGKPEIALSNVIGSNIMNITLVLGLTFLVAKKINPQRDLFKHDSAWLVIPAALLFLVVFDSFIGRFESVALLVMMAAYIWFLKIHSSYISTEDMEIDTQLKNEPFSWIRVLPLLIAGFVMVTGGAHYAVQSGSSIALGLGMSQWLVGLLLISLGTSLPELVVSIAAARKDKADMAIGNIIGSNLANIAVALGAAGLIAPIDADIGSKMYDLVMMGFVTIVLVFMLANRFYNKAAGLILVTFLALFLHNSVSSL
ncbi:MAG: calcium/sodium antiporter [Campylobacterota bacterium]